MANTVIALKKSSTPSAEPTTLANGELAINFADGKLFYKNSTGQIVSFTSGSNSFGTVNANGTLIISDTVSDVLTIEAGNNISIVGDAINDKITIGLQNDITVPGTIYVKSVGGNEGGEIQLGNAVTNSVLSGNVVIDIYQNQIRFFESSGSNRGAYINLASAGTAVGTDLLAAASSTDSTARAAASAAYDKANSANYYTYLVDANTTAAFAKANAALPNTSGISFNGNLNFPTGNVGIGTASPTSKLTVANNSTIPTPISGTLLHVVQSDSGPQSRILLDSFSSAPNFTFRRSQGTAASPSAITAGSSIVSMTSFGYGTTGYSNASRASIISYAEEDWTDTAHGTYWLFSTTPIGSITSTEKMRITANGNIGIGISSPGTKFSVFGSSNSGITTVTDNTSIVLDMTSNNNFTITLGGSNTFINPTTMNPGQSGIIWIIQDSGGSRAPSWGSYWRFPSNTAPTLSTAANSVDAIVYVVRNSTSITAQAILNVG